MNHLIRAIKALGQQQQVNTPYNNLLQVIQQAVALANQLKLTDVAEALNESLTETQALINKPAEQPTQPQKEQKTQPVPQNTSQLPGQQPTLPTTPASIY